MNTPLYFITGNRKKFQEASAILDNLEQLDIDLAEIQDIDPEKIIRSKLQLALKQHNGPLIVEDISFKLECLNGLPGPLIKWFLLTIGTKGLADIATRFGNKQASVKAVLGYADNRHNIKFFNGEIQGSIVSPRGDRGFGFDSIFVPLGHMKTFAEMSFGEKNIISHRRIALEKLKKYLRSS